MSMKPAFYVHVPHCAGTTLWSILRDVYGEDHTLRFHKVAQARAFVASADPDQEFAAFNAFGGHVHLADAVPRAGGRVLFTMLRDPIRHAITQYFRVTARENWTPDPALGDRDILKFIADMGYDRIFPDYMGPAPDATDAAAIKAFMSEHLALVGLTEDFDRSLHLLADTLNWPDVPTYDRRNVGGFPETPISEATRGEIAELMALPQAVYQHGVEMFQSACAARPDVVSEARLAAYQKANVARERRLKLKNFGFSPFVRSGPLWKLKTLLTGKRG